MLKLTINLLVYVALGLALGTKRRKPSPKPKRAHVRMMPWASCLTCPAMDDHFYLNSN